MTAAIDELARKHKRLLFQAETLGQLKRDLLDQAGETMLEITEKTREEEKRKNAS